MKKSLMSNIKNFVDSNVRHRIDRVAHNNNEFFTDDLLLVERHFEDLRRVCTDAEKKISTLLLSIQASNSTSQLGSYTQNVHAGFSSLSQNISQQATGLTTGSSQVQQKQSTGLSNVDCSNQSVHHNPDELLNSNNLNTIVNSTGQGASIRQQYSVSTNASAFGQEQLSDDVKHRYKKLPIVGFHRFLLKTSQKLKSDSLLSISLTHCTQLQTQLTKMFLAYEQTIEAQCLKPVQSMLENDIPNVIKLRKLFIKSHNDLESLRAKYIGASMKQQHAQHPQLSSTSSSASYTVTQNSAQQINANKLDQLKKELDEAVMRYEQAKICVCLLARDLFTSTLPALLTQKHLSKQTWYPSCLTLIVKDIYEAEIYGFICRETELANLIVRFYYLQADYHQQVGAIIQNSLPTLANTLASTPRKFAFCTALDEHLRCTGRTISPVLEICVHFLYTQGLKEEGLFRIPGSSIKIRKLRNAINAWFVNLTNLNDLEGDPAGHACIVALYQLFKNVVGKQITYDNHSGNQASGDDQSVNQGQEQQPSQSDISECLILDVHTIAGLLKLYLRELPEPLFTHALYEQWISALKQSTKKARSDESQDVSMCQQQRNECLCDAMKEVILKLPSSNYENLKHLIRFLHLLTTNQQYNKMTSTNLAIAMAPSLIWSKPTEESCNQNGSVDDLTNQTATIQQQAMSMSSFGISASLHAMLLDALITNADLLFPEPADFSLSGFKELSLIDTGNGSKLGDPKRGSSTADRPLKSTSPAGLSVASSSSFSSNASNPANVSVTNSEAIIKTHSRKGGSMDGLMVGSTLAAEAKDKESTTELSTTAVFGESNDRPATTTSLQRAIAFKSNRPVSVQIRREDYAMLGHQPTSKARAPPVPPMPLTRSHNVKQQTTLVQSDSREPPTGAADSKSEDIKNLSQSSKPPSPSVPPPTNPHQKAAIANLAITVDASSNVVVSDEDTKRDQQMRSRPITSPRPVSLRGTGTISNTPAATNSEAFSCAHGSINSIRPSVPPPKRPESIGNNSHRFEPPELDCDKSTKINRDLSLPSPSSPVDTIDVIKSASPVISLDSISVNTGEDSSFNEVNTNSIEFQQSLQINSAPHPSKPAPLKKPHGLVTSQNRSKNSLYSSESKPESITKSCDIKENMEQVIDFVRNSECSRAIDHDDQRLSPSCHQDELDCSKVSSEACTKRTSIPEPPRRPPRSTSPKTTVANAVHVDSAADHTPAEQNQYTPL